MGNIKAREILEQEFKATNAYEGICGSDWIAFEIESMREPDLTVPRFSGDTWNRMPKHARMTKAMR